MRRAIAKAGNEIHAARALRRETWAPRKEFSSSSISGSVSFNIIDCKFNEPLTRPTTGMALLLTPINGRAGSLKTSTLVSVARHEFEANMTIGRLDEMLPSNGASHSFGSQ